ncbi:MAG: hypothetical protein EOO99_03055 [Pedobacter sp.]|nr:MAG: hypothetical protein EOO99_03055 [Pedobacter sp.]
MQNSQIEITDQEYCIKLSRQVFSIGLLHQLIRKIQQHENVNPQFDLEDSNHFPQAFGLEQKYSPAGVENK